MPAIDPATRTATVKLRELCPLLFVQDIERSIAFYALLGFRVASQANSEEKIFWCRLERDTCALMLQQAEPEDGPAASRRHG